MASDLYKEYSKKWAHHPYLHVPQAIYKNVREVILNQEQVDILFDAIKKDKYFLSMNYSMAVHKILGHSKDEIISNEVLVRMYFEEAAIYYTLMEKHNLISNLK